MENPEQKAVAERSPAGQVFLAIFIIFNIVMAIILLPLILTPMRPPPITSVAQGFAAPFGAAIGRAIAIAGYSLIWASGSAILGLAVFLTRKRTRR